MYLLIIGPPRSGTTLFASMMGMHSDVAMLIEDKFFAIKRLTGKKVLANKLCIPNQMEIVKKANYVSRTLKKVGLYSTYPTSRYNAGDYMQLEGIKILAIIRDGNDVISSIMKRGRKEQKVAKARWCRSVEMIDELFNMHPGKIALVSYEDLVREPGPLLNKVAAFVGIDFQEQMLEGYKHNILYPGEKGIDATKALKSKSVIAENLYGIDQVTRDKYAQLMQMKIDPGSKTPDNQ